MRVLRTFIIATLVLLSSTAMADKIHNPDGTLVDFSDGSVTVGVEVPGGAGLATSALQTTGNASLVTIANNTTAGTVTDSAAAAQNANWLLVSDGTSNDTDHGTMTVVAANTAVGKEFHEISVAMPDSSDDFDMTIQVFAVNTVPSAVFTLAGWLSVSSLVVPAYRISRDQAEVTVGQPLIRSHATYLLVVLDTVTANPTGDPELRIFSYNAGDSR